MPGGPRGSAARRMSAGLTRLTGDRHVHYRRLLLQPLHRANVHAMAEKMAHCAAAEIAAWPLEQDIDLSEYARRLMRDIALELLFGGCSEQSRTIADRVSRLMERKWDSSVIAFPVNLPVTPYGRVVRDAEILERLILQWAETRRGDLDESDLASIIVNTSDPDGHPPDDAVIVGQLGSLIAAAFEASHSVLLWTLVLLLQNPRVAAVLLDELRDKLGGQSPALDKAGELPYLDAVVKESMRVLPPVPCRYALPRAIPRSQDMRCRRAPASCSTRFSRTAWPTLSRRGYLSTRAVVRNCPISIPVSGVQWRPIYTVPALCLVRPPSKSPWRPSCPAAVWTYCLRASITESSRPCALEMVSRCVCASGMAAHRRRRGLPAPSTRWYDCRNNLVAKPPHHLVNPRLSFDDAGCRCGREKLRRQSGWHRLR